MNILLVNGSPRPSGSASESILEAIIGKLGPDHLYTKVTPRLEPRASAACLGQDAIVIAFPLYVDSLPSRLLEWLLSFESLTPPSVTAPETARPRAATAVFAICNCGFYEGVQTRAALRIVHNFARKNGFSWGGCLGIGTGGMITGLATVPEEAGIKREVSHGIAWIADGIRAWGARSDGQAPATEPNFDESVRYVRHAFPRFAYILVAHSGWRSMARANGVKSRNLKARPIER
jgi:hypothetical protein